MSVVTWISNSMRRVSPNRLSGVFRLGPILYGVQDDDAISLGQLKSFQGTTIPLVTELTGYNINVGLNSVYNPLGCPAKHITFIGDDGWPMYLAWKPTPGFENESITISSLEEFTDVTINIIAYTTYQEEAIPKPAPELPPSGNGPFPPGQPPFPPKN